MPQEHGLRERHLAGSPSSPVARPETVALPMAPGGGFYGARGPACAAAMGPLVEPAAISGSPPELGGPACEDDQQHQRQLEALAERLRAAVRALSGGGVGHVAGARP